VEASEGDVSTVCNQQVSISPSPAPIQARVVGYGENTFGGEFDRCRIDLGDSGGGKFDWYVRQFFGHPKTDQSNLGIVADGSLLMRGPASLNTAAPLPDGGWTGVAFGGGAYFEATLKFDPDEVFFANNVQWPSFWSLSVEHLAGLPSEHWAGEALGFKHFAEADFFEYDVWSFAGPLAYGGATHDWYGEYGRTCLRQYCGVSNAPGGGTHFGNFVVSVPSGNNFNDYHRYGYLWVPATNSTDGYAQHFFDDVPTGDRIHWSRFENQAPPPGAASWTFGIMDWQHMVVVLSVGRNQTMSVKSVNIWQSGSAANWRHRD